MRESAVAPKLDPETSTTSPIMGGFTTPPVESAWQELSSGSSSLGNHAMTVTNAIHQLPFQVAQNPSVSRQLELSQVSRESVPNSPPQDELRDTFREFVGETFYGQLLASMRKTVGKPAYLHGGRAEEVFQGQLDQVLSQHMTEASADQFADPMFELFQLNLR